MRNSRAGLAPLRGFPEKSTGRRQQKDWHSGAPGRAISKRGRLPLHPCHGARRQQWVPCSRVPADGRLQCRCDGKLHVRTGQLSCDSALGRNYPLRRQIEVLVKCCLFTYTRSLHPYVRLNRPCTARRVSLLKCSHCTAVGCPRQEHARLAS